MMDCNELTAQDKRMIVCDLLKCLLCVIAICLIY